MRLIFRGVQFFALVFVLSVLLCFVMFRFNVSPYFVLACSFALGWVCHVVAYERRLNEDAILFSQYRDAMESLYRLVDCMAVRALQGQLEMSDWRRVAGAAFWEQHLGWRVESARENFVSISRQASLADDIFSRFMSVEEMHKMTDDNFLRKSGVLNKGNNEKETV